MCRVDCSNWLKVAVVLLLPAAAVAQEPPADLAAREEQAFKEAAALVAASVVRVQTVGGFESVGRVLTGTGPTTGLVVSADGYIISSTFNFASQPSSVLVELPDGRRLPAKTVAHDRARMLTLLKIDVTGLKPASAAPKESFAVGQWAIALGRTYDTPAPSLSVGILSALDRIWGRAVQTDAKVSPINYGGPLVDIEGRVIGVLAPLSQRATGRTAGVEWYDSGIGFAVPLADVYSVLDRLKTGKDLLPGLLGITLKRADPYATAAVIDRVRYNSPAGKAGFQPGDTIVEIDGKKIARIVQVKHVLGNRYAEDKLQVVVRRKQQLIKSDLVLAGKLEPYESAYLGILPSRSDRGDGAGVRLVLPQSPAATAGLVAGEHIVGFDDTAVTDAAGLLDLVSRQRPGTKARLEVLRGQTRRMVEVTLARVPDVVPAAITPVEIPVPAAPAAGADSPRTGRFTEDLKAHEHSYWAYVPETYNPKGRYGLMVWIHPFGDTMEADLLAAWQAVCDARGIILVGPKAAKVSGWNLNEAGFVEAVVKLFQDRYSIDSTRVFLHSFSDGARFGWHLAFKYRELFRGVAIAAEPLRTRAPENRPEFRMQVQLVCGAQDNLLRLVRRTRDLLKSMKYPVSFTTVTGESHTYPPVEFVDEIGRWADCLDRI